jgi:hypothetical protein
MMWCMYLVLVVIAIMQILLYRKMKCIIEFLYQNHVMILKMHHCLKAHYSANFNMTYTESKGDDYGQ